jgi:DNA polymerase-3 subunit epsilon
MSSDDKNFIVLDTETTGLSPLKGHRVIEIGCVAVDQRQIVENHYHVYINPQRPVDPGAMAVHGITNEFLQDKQVFGEIASAFLDFVKGKTLVIHNAPFDMGFLDHELSLLDLPSLSSQCQVVDSLYVARRKYQGQKNSLDAICQRLGIDNSHRDKHGALLDAQLLAEVYLKMTAKQEDFLDRLIPQDDEPQPDPNQLKSMVWHRVKPTEQELKAHQEFMKDLPTDTTD